MFGLSNSENLMQYTLPRKHLEYVASYVKLKCVKFNSRKYFSDFKAGIWAKLNYEIKFFENYKKKYKFS